MRTVSLACVILMLGGCVGRYAFTPTMDADPTEIGGEGLILMTELSKAYVREKTDLCDHLLPSFQEEAKHTYSRHNKPPQTAATIFRCYGFRPVVDEADKAAVASYLRSGFALSDLYCDTFFRRIAKHSNQRRYARNNVNDVGAAVSAVLGLAAAGSGLTGGVGAGFALSDNLFRNYDDNFLVTADLQTLQPKVRDEQDKFRAQSYAAMPENYQDAHIAIIRYANLCSFTGMKSLLNQAVVKTTQSKPFEERLMEYRVLTQTREERYRAEVDRQRAALAAEADQAGAAEEDPETGEGEADGPEAGEGGDGGAN